MNIPFLDNWLKRHGGEHEENALTAGSENDPERAAAVAELLSECELLRVRAGQAGLELDDSPASLGALDQLPPRWRDDPEELPWLGNDAGLYLGTVIVRTVPGATWHIWPGGHPVVRLVSGREIGVVEAGLDWAVTGAPQLSQVYAEAAEA
ncbi:hypothetical protein HRW23_24200 [Streptomyces lunaelactis]|uniref:DUF6278 family protein n=1 Tax=Streptomyces lunaelactis TaxID=1535768 RepID=UPI00158571FB|nr:DUF6278 family protein [Streptomyces lunaelactis]NUK03945.1 hypothetical protein [Streptomyces lunaelactis]NUK10908.1 hypothetical protein [Streptomyces lunaelactis]NUK18441.1 hypothetical protein [Streptomyces lunaelactis]NUK25876.1 hypothetical protein [Streptomyces lunaelactis]NUK37242.1 hypothetical protein [Streptomyces lunaelactis]